MVQIIRDPSQVASTKPGNRLTVFYDGGCALCRQQVAFWQRLDREGLIEWQDISQDARPLLRTGISHRLALRRLYARAPDGRILHGARVIAAVMCQVPALQLVGRLVKVPPFIWMFDLLYLLISPLRRLLTGRWRNCCGDE
ncbi:MAG TPA: DUF393 domain-containing protein [Kiloniellales bacterium]|jgi:predicted DCC family thiol-disulfide oxidoreductase YuxK|nr:DUF393 domain-containing protein [Kiloniellales bacterium]